MDNKEKFKEFINNGESPFRYERNVLCQHWNKVKKIVQGEETTPYEIEVQSSSTCNLHCNFCVGAMHKPKDVVAISPERMRQIVGGIIKSGVERIKFSGYYGEPLMNKDATVIGMGLAIYNGVKVGLFTNGTLVDDEVASTLMNAEYVNISLDAGSRESYRKIKGLDLFDVVIAKIKLLDRIRKERKSKLEITVGYILSKENYKEIPKAVELLKDHADMIRFKVNIRNGDMSKEELDEAYELIEEAKGCEDENFKIIKIHSRLEADRMRKPTFNRCYFQYLMGCMGCDGKYYPCDHKTYHGGDKKDLIPSRDCELCPPMGFRINRFLEFIENEYKRGNAFMDWIEKYVREELCHE